MVLALILDSLGSTELLFILVVALIFFGPRKLPQLARSMGKSMAEFRKASEDFKRTWEREVALESSKVENTENSILPEHQGQPINAGPIVEPPLAAVSSPEAVARGNASLETNPASTKSESTETSSSEPLPKHEWL
jgi:TatA/E family protein of Tat protein translocase